MLKKKFWIPSVFCLICVVIALIFTGYQRGASQPPVKIYKSVEVQQPTTLKPPPPGETYETGHWHGDEWHSEAHEPVVKVDDTPENVLPHLNLDADLQARLNAESEVSRQQGETDAERQARLVEVLEDAGHRFATDAEIQDAEYRKRLKQWAKDYDTWKPIEDEAYTEWMEANEALLNLIDEVTRPGFSDNISDLERQQLITKVQDMRERRIATSQKLETIRQKTSVPTQPEPAAQEE